MTNDPIFNKIADALLADYTSVYYVNAVTDEYSWYSSDPKLRAFHEKHGGRDFFANVISNSQEMVYEPDRQTFLHEFNKENLLAQMKRGTLKNIEYRLMIDGKPVYHSLRLIRGVMDDDDYFILGVLNIDDMVRARHEAERAEQEREVFNQIAGSLAEHYDTLYYVDIQTNKYFEFSSSDDYKSLQIPTSGDDFFKESRKNIRKLVHPDDVDRVVKLFYKERMLQNLADKNTVKVTYRLNIGGKQRYYRTSQIWASDRKHVIIGIENIDKEIQTEKKLKETQKKNVTYEQIAESLASHYDVIYYIDSSSGRYAEFTSNHIYGNLELQEEGVDFFADAQHNIVQLVHPNDAERVAQVLERDFLISALEDNKQLRTDYRLIVNGKTQYTRSSVIWSSDKIHFIIGVENINAEVKREKEQVKALDQANDLARRDELTGVRNKKAFSELEVTVQHNIDSGLDYFPFALVVFDINNLKLVNDSLGHKAGDEYIRAACRLICNVFTHSQVFRIGGDEFVAFLGSGDFFDRIALLEKLKTTVRENLINGEGAVIAAGMAIFERDMDDKFSDVFERADSKMYEDKNRLKEVFRTGVNMPEKHRIDAAIPTERRTKLEGLFKAFSIISEGTYVYLCDMKYDYSIWSKTAVDAFGLPAERMYRAGDIWEEHIHPDDRETYRNGINDIFTGNAAGHDMQYRARRVGGEYDVCTCRGIVLRDDSGAPDYFGGVIRNHDILGHIDELTGLRNQYGFFEDLKTVLETTVPVRVFMVGISRFSEINELYGYHFGNNVLQRFGRLLFEHVANDGSAYRLDGTKFAVISSTQTLNEMEEKYEDLRSFCREKFYSDDKKLVLELNAGAINVDYFNIDYQTIYACLNFAYGESKIKAQGDAVEFTNGRSKDSKRHIEQLHTIRDSIIRAFRGFFLLFQPVVDPHAHRLVGGEALLRWQNEEYGVVPPDSFIPVLERDPLFCGLGEWVLKMSVKAGKKMREIYPDFVMNVNVSYSQLEKPDFVDMVLNILKKYDYPPENLCLEITERCRLLDFDLLKNIFVNLRGRGVRIALDDFGTGFSSVGLVKHFTFDVIKIDRSFVRKIEDDETERKLLESFMELAGIFSAAVCVEGIETAQMRDIIRNYNVNSMQGYYFAKPLPFDEFIDWEYKE